MVMFAERGVKEGQEITWSYGDSYRSHRKEMGYRAGTRADPNAITPQQARTAFARYCKKDRRDEGGASVELWMHIGKPK